MILSVVKQVKHGGVKVSIDAKVYISPEWALTASGPIAHDENEDNSWENGLTYVAAVHPSGEFGKQFVVRESPDEIQAFRIMETERAR